MTKPYHEWVKEHRAASIGKAFGYFSGLAVAHAEMIQDAPDRLKKHYRLFARRYGQEARRDFKRLQEEGLLTNPLDEVGA